MVADIAMIDRLTFWESASKLSLLSMLAVGLAIVYWLKTSYRHVREVIGATGFKQEGWVFWGWVIPVLNLFKPYQVIMELYRAGGTKYHTPEGWKDSLGSGVILFWWIVWVALHFMMAMAFNMLNQATGAAEITWAQYSLSLASQVFAIVLGMIVSVLWFVVVNHLTRRLIERAPLLGRASAGQPLNSAQPAMLRPMPAGNTAVTPPQSTRSMQPVEPAKATTPQAPTKADIDPSQFVIDEEAIYEQIANEVDSGNVRKGLWTKLWAEADGDDAKVKLAYIRIRVAQIASDLQEQRSRTKAEQEAKELADAKFAFEMKLGTVKEQLANLVKLPFKEIDNAKMKVLRDGTQSAFWAAIRYGDIFHVRDLVEQNPIHVLFVDVDGNTPLRIAVQIGNVEVARYLLACGIDPDKKNAYGVSARDQLAKNGTSEMVELFEPR